MLGDTKQMGKKENGKDGSLDHLLQNGETTWFD